MTTRNVPAGISPALSTASVLAMTRYLTRDRIAIVAALVVPLAAAVLLAKSARVPDVVVKQARLVAVTLAGQAGQAYGATRTVRSVS